MKIETLLEKNGLTLMYVEATLLKGVTRGYFVVMEKERAERFKSLKEPTVLDFTEQETLSYLISDNKQKEKTQAIEYFNDHFLTERIAPKCIY